MITPLLEKMLITGEAQHMVFNCTSKSAFLPLPNKSIGIIHNIQCAPFTDCGSRAQQNETLPITHTVLHQLRIFSRRGQNMFLQRSIFDWTLDDTGSLRYLVKGDNFDYHTFLVHEGNVGIQWLHNPNIALWTLTTNEQPNTLNDMQPPIGYGTDLIAGSIKTEDEIKYNDTRTTVYRPRGHAANTLKDGLPETGQFTFPVEPDTNLNSVNTAEDEGFGIYSFPIVTLQVILINNDKLTTIVNSI